MFNDPKVNQMRQPGSKYEEDTLDENDRYGYEQTGKKKGKKKKVPVHTANKSITEEWKKDLNRKMLYVVYQYTRKEEGLGELEDTMNRSIDYTGTERL
jgi:hypothetical protein